MKTGILHSNIIISLFQMLVSLFRLLKHKINYMKYPYPYLFVSKPVRISCLFSFQIQSFIIIIVHYPFQWNLRQWRAKSLTVFYVQFKQMNFIVFFSIVYRVLLLLKLAIADSILRFSTKVLDSNNDHWILNTGYGAENRKNGNNKSDAVHSMHKNGKSASKEFYRKATEKH